MIGYALIAISTATGTISYTSDVIFASQQECENVFKMEVEKAKTNEMVISVSPKRRETSRYTPTQYKCVEVIVPVNDTTKKRYKQTESKKNQGLEMNLISVQNHNSGPRVFRCKHCGDRINQMHETVYADLDDIPFLSYYHAHCIRIKLTNINRFKEMV